MKTMQRKMWLYILIGMLTTIVVVAFARMSYGVVLPFMREGLGITYQQAGLLGTTTAFGYLITVMGAGVLAAKWGGKKTILLGISVVSAGFLGLAIIPFYWSAYLFMFLLGVGTGFTFTPLISLLVGWFPSKKGTVIGLTISGIGIGMFLTGIVVPYLSNIYLTNGWRMSWGVFASVSLLLLVLIAIFIKDPPALENGEIKEAKPNPIDIYKNRNVITVGLIYGIIGVSYMIQMLFIMSFMIEEGIDVTLAGQLMALNGILSIFSGPFWGYLSDKFGRRIMLNITIGLVITALLLPIVAPTLIGFSLHVIIISCTMVGLFTLIQAASMDHVKPAEMPIAFSYATFYFAFGQFIGPTIGGWLIEDIGGFKSAFLFASSFLLIGFVLTFTIKNPEQLSPPVSELKQEVQ